jgi:hypothetical protein
MAGKSGQAGVQPAQAVNENSQGLYENIHNREPVLIFETSGYTLTGAMHRHLAVYTDGTASISVLSGLPGEFEGDADFTNVPLSAVEQLRQNLITMGADRLQDQKLLVQDVPLRTVTFFKRPGPNAKSHTFNYYLAFDSWAGVHLVIDDFISQWFPGF